MNIKLAIADADLEYVERLMNVLEGYEGVSLSVYTERKAFEYALSTKRFDVVLFSPTVYEGQVSLGKSTLGILLLDESMMIPENCQTYKKIKKYQKISRMYQQILSLYSEISQGVGDVLGQGSVRTVAFYSPIGAGKTTLALASATKFAQHGYRTFYLNLEDMASEECYLPQTGEKGLSEIVAHLGDNINLSMKIQGLLQTKINGLFYLNHFDSPNDIHDISEQEITELIDELKKSALFDVIVVDLGCALNEKTKSVFEAADKVVLVEKTDGISLSKMQLFFRQMHIINEFSDKMVRVMNFDIGRASVMPTNIQIIGKISVAQNPDAAQLISVIADDQNSNFILQLVG